MITTRTTRSANERAAAAECADAVVTVQWSLFCYCCWRRLSASTSYICPTEGHRHENRLPFFYSFRFRSFMRAHRYALPVATAKCEYIVVTIPLAFGGISLAWYCVVFVSPERERENDSRRQMIDFTTQL